MRHIGLYTFKVQVDFTFRRFLCYIIIKCLGWDTFYKGFGWVLEVTDYVYLTHYILQPSILYGVSGEHILCGIVGALAYRPISRLGLGALAGALYSGQ